MGANALLLRTSDLEPAIKALAEAFRNPKTAVPPSGPLPRGTAGMTPLHKERVQIQLERQMARNDALVRRGAIQAAALSVVRGLAEALARPRDLASVLGDVLVHCLDATGVSTGLLYLAQPDGGFHLRAQAGLPAEARAEAAACFGHPEVLRRCLDAGDPGGADDRGGPIEDPAMRAFAERLGRSSVLVIPFVVAQERVGVLLLAADGQDFSETVWLGFARTLAVQFGQTIAVGQSLTRGAASQARYQTVMEHANDAILLLDDRGIVEANRQAEILLGRPRAEIAGRPYHEFVVGDDDAPVPSVFGESTTRMEDQRLRRADGSTVSVDVSASPVRIGDETIVVLILRDITDRKRAERRLQESEEQYRHLFDSNPHPMWVYEPETLAFLAVNDAAVQMYGYSRQEFLRMNIRDIRPPEDIPALLERLAARDRGEPGVGVFRHRLKSGAIVDVEVASNALLFRGRPARLVLVNDVSEKQRLEAQLLQAQKMEAVGRLAGGVAHDFNNLLGVITGYSELLGRDPRAPASRTRQAPGDPESGGARGGPHAAAPRLQPQAGPGDPGPGPEPHRDRAGEDAAAPHRRGHPAPVEIRGRPLAGPRGQRTDRAGDRQPGRERPRRHAQGRHPGPRDVERRGRRFLRAIPRRREPGRLRHAHGERHRRGHGRGHAGTHLRAVLHDQGGGQGHGPGAGHRLRDREAERRAHPRLLGAGRRLDVQGLPPARGRSGGAGAGGRSPSLPLRGHETILLVEDAEALRVMIREILEAAGYGVIECGEPAEALRKSTADVARADLLLTDVIMPQASGPEVARALREKHPALKVLFMSGYTNQAIGHHGVLEEGAPLLEKPFTTDSLLRKVRSVLDAR